MGHLTESYLESLGFSVSQSKDHDYHTQFTKYDKSIEHAIILVSRDLVVDSTLCDDLGTLDIWFWGPTSSGSYKDVETMMSLSTVEELSVLLGYLKY